ncbi:MAG: TatD family hydrolase [Akkermansiaceae bacterium]
MLTDSHCHLASHKFPAEEIPALIQRAQDNHIHRLITLATSLDDLEPNLHLAKTYPQIHAAIAIHPCDVHNTPDHYLTTLQEKVTHPKICAIGETGLDYFHPAPQGWTEENYHARQRQFLHQHFQLAAEHNKNIVIHTRDKTGHASLTDAVEIYRQYADKVTAVFHCFLGPWENAHHILDLGGYLSYTGITTFKKATITLEAAVKTPSDRIMVETDSPYLAPTPHRGKRNEPAYTLHTATHIAAARGIPLEEFAHITEQNVNTFFKL